MREILFRGKLKYNNEWIYWNAFGEICKLNGKRTRLSIPSKSGEGFYYHIHQIRQFILPETVGQYTGLTDKNGKKIFEGDIFKFSDEVFESYYTSCGTEYGSWEVENYGVVGFCEHSGRFDFIEYKLNENSVEADLHENNSLDFAEFVSELEVIGNIHDNPELLKEGAEDGNTEKDN